MSEAGRTNHSTDQELPCLSFLVCMPIKQSVELCTLEIKAMEYSVNQIYTLLRTYPQHLKARLTLRDKKTPTSYVPSSVDHVSISPEGRRRLEEAETTHSASEA